MYLQVIKVSESQILENFILKGSCNNDNESRKFVHRRRTDILWTCGGFKSSLSPPPCGCNWETASTASRGDD